MTPPPPSSFSAHSLNVSVIVNSVCRQLIFSFYTHTQLASTISLIEERNLCIVLYLCLQDWTRFCHFILHFFYSLTKWKKYIIHIDWIIIRCKLKGFAIVHYFWVGCFLSFQKVERKTSRHSLVRYTHTYMLISQKIRFLFFVLFSTNIAY